ncbi:F-box-like domain superfamily [Arabidopsis thaliana x Arabidopsis arenosa]|uniref:F-box-like domain superfamily n=1 Tax=Arabidopsis thaliana x Arabidopsis arenosa TaxID=1240361 RepID=A0A8T1Z357_9BRAS|nr:F-box-like domain superfamily [Arabidopsis thaliana x Arabidopsis arenosa]
MSLILYMYEMLSQVANDETSPSVMMSLPDDLIMDIIARVSRFNYAALSLVCKKFRFLISLTDELYKRRSLLGSTEYCVYVRVLETQNNVVRMYILNQKNKRNMPCLAPILSLPHMPLSASYDVVGSNIFVMGGFYDHINGPPSSTALCIDCRTHVARHVANMPITFSGIVRSKVIDEKINVFGRSVDEPSMTWESEIVMVFDTRTETWEHGTKPDSEVDPRWFKSFSTVTDEHHINAQENKWETDEILHYNLYCDECVMDDVLYRHERDTNILKTYDLKQRIWGVVKGLEKFPLISSNSNMVSCGKKLILFLQKDDFAPIREIWCVEITVERREGGEIWGKIECCDLLLDGCFYLFNCLAVLV